jgi:hypothetical protein
MRIRDERSRVREGNAFKQTAVLTYPIIYIEVYHIFVVLIRMESYLVVWIRRGGEKQTYTFRT